MIVEAFILIVNAFLFSALQLKNVIHRDRDKQVILNYKNRPACICCNDPIQRHKRWHDQKKKTETLITPFHFKTLSLYLSYLSSAQNRQLLMYQKFKKKVHILLHPELGDSKWDKILNAFIITLIALNVVAVMLETVEGIDTKYKTFFDAFDLISVLIFTIEYALRVWSCTADPKYKGSVKGRLKYMLTPGAIIDLLAFLPFYIHRILYHLLHITVDLRVLRILRLMRFFRLFRLTAYTRSAQMIFNVFKNRMRELVLSFVLTIFLIIIASCIMYFVEHQYPTIKESKFTSIPETLWWAVVSLTTTGYGDMYPLTPLGKFLGGIIMLTGVAFFALPAGIITAGFLEEMRIIRKGKSYKCPHCGGDITSFVHHHHMEGEN